MIADAQFWDDIAERYAAKPVEDMPAYERKVALTKARLRPRDRVLDIGCGTGSLALELAPQVGEMHGLDISGEMIRIAEDKAKAAGATNVQFHTQTLNQGLPFEPESFDVICAYNILHLVDDPAALLTTVHGLLAPGGVFVSSTPCLGESWIPFRPVLAVMRWLGKAPKVKLLSIADLERDMRAAGFIGLSRPDVGAKPTIAFMIANRPRVE